MKNGECTHLVFSSRHNVAVNSSQTVPKWDISPILGQTRPNPRHYRLSANILPILSTSTVPFWDTITSSTSARRYPSKSSLARVFAVSPSFNQELAQFMLYIVRRHSFRLDRKIEASNNSSRGRRRRHCSVMPAAPLRRGMERGKEHPGTYYNRHFAYPWVPL